MSFSDGGEPPPPTPPHGEGGKSFAEGAGRLAGLAAHCLGWRPQEFWAATPSELALLLAPPAPGGSPPSRAEILALIERDADG